MSSEKAKIPFQLGTVSLLTQANLQRLNAPSSLDGASDGVGQKAFDESASQQTGKTGQQWRRSPKFLTEQDLEVAVTLGNMRGLEAAHSLGDTKIFRLINKDEARSMLQAAGTIICQEADIRVLEVGMERPKFPPNKEEHTDRVPTVVKTPKGATVKLRLCQGIWNLREDGHTVDAITERARKEDGLEPEVVAELLQLGKNFWRSGW